MWSGPSPNTETMTPPPVNRETVTAFSPGARPWSWARVGQPKRESASSFSARTTRHVFPNVPLSVLCGRNPARLRRQSRQKRPTVVFAWNPSRSAPC